MSDGQILDALRSAIWTAVTMSSPMLGAALIVGLVVGVLQALTSVQEMTLTFVPKIAALGAVLWLSMDFMGRAVIGLYKDLVIPTVAAG